MKKPTLHHLRRREHLMRSISLALVVTFATQLVAPVVSAAEQAGARPDPPAARHEARPPGRLQKIVRVPGDPTLLSHTTLKGDARNRPKSTRGDFSRAGLMDNPSVQLAALGDFTYAHLAGAGDPAYLAETTEVRLSPAIQDKAAELSHDPVAIYHWVRNHIEWLPTWGAMQDADLTLGSRRGNAFDIASLLIALLRASGIPSRYVHGTIELPAARFQDWAGGFTTPEAALHYAASGGIPIEGVVSGGKVASVRMEHIWVEAAIDYLPSRGAINRDADSWIALDASYKQYDHLAGLDAAAITGIDPATLAQSFLASGEVNEQEGWATGFDPTILERAETQAAATLEAYITTHLPGATVGDVIGGSRTIVQEAPVLPSSLPNRVVVEGTRYAEIPPQLQHRVTFMWERDSLGQWADPVTLPWAAVNNQKLTLSFKPATAADEEALRALLPSGPITDPSQLPTTIPAYLIHVIPELTLNGVVVKRGSPMGLGREIPFTFRLDMPGQALIKQATSPVPAGSYLAVATVGGSVSPAILQTLQARVATTKATLESGDPTRIGALTREALLGDLFYAGTLGYFAQYTALAHVMSLAAGGRHTLMPSVGTYGYVPKVRERFGLPAAIEPGGVAMDLDAVNSITDSLDGDAVKRRNLVFETGILSSALESAVPEQMFVTPDNPGEAISTVKALEKANLAGQRIVHITAANEAAVLPNLHLDPDTITEIQAALHAGKEVITHTDPVTVPGWTGAGYIIFDPETGEGAYRISGGQSGSWFLAGVAILALGIIALAGGALGVAISPLLGAVAVSLGVHVVIFSVLFEPDIDFSELRDPLLRIVGITTGVIGAFGGAALAIVIVVDGILGIWGLL